MTDHMPRAIEQLQLDHRNMTRLLDVLRKELDAYRSGRTPDFDLLNSIMDYTLNYPDLCHHPKENLIYERMAARVSRDSEIPRAWFEGIIESYLAANYRHIAAEEETFFPQAVLTLNQADWSAIDASVTAPEDPLFGGKVTKDYRALYERIMRSIV